MRLRFLGANRQVTGSRYLLETGERQIMIDCGLFQEREYTHRNWDQSPVPEKEIDLLLLTHIHIDHCGLIPRLVKQGFHQPILATHPSVGLADIVFRDSARIQVEDADYKKKRHRREGRKTKFPEVPLYNEADAEAALKLMTGVSYLERKEIAPGVTAQFLEAGHILGSSSIRIEVERSGQTTSIVFSGDVGQHDKPLIRDPAVIRDADYLVMESTYGDRDHLRAGDIDSQLEDVINRTVGRGGNVVIPTFAIERAQELMYYISRLVHSDRIPDIHVFLDSPMAVDVTELFRRYPECFDEETWNLMNSREPPLRFPGLQLARSVEQSRAINEHRLPCVIMATSGMCTAGRIKHHLRLNVSKPESTVLFVGYQSHGTLGRHILDRKPEVRIHGRSYPLRAEVAQIYGFSGHADRQGLLDWLNHLDGAPRKVFLTHGELDAAESLAAAIREARGFDVEIPEYLSAAEL